MSKTGIAVALVLTLLLSCEDSLTGDCNECYPGGIPPAKLIILYMNPDYVPANPVVTLYEGSVEDGIIISTYVIDVGISFLEVDALYYKDYSATLEFFHEGQKYITTAGACPQSGYDESTCEEPCYFIYDNVLDLRLRYD